MAAPVATANERRSKLGLVVFGVAPFMERENEEAWFATEATAKKHAINLNILIENSERSIASVEYVVWKRCYNTDHGIRWLPKAKSSQQHSARKDQMTDDTASPTYERAYERSNP